ncbi:MAG: cobaltochelatase subunit CobN [Candidatus Heimdallarchaeaceae archaeon]
MKRILALTTINNTFALKEAVEEINKEYGNIVQVHKIYFDDYEHPDISLEPLEKEIDAADIVLVDIRGDIRVSRELPKMLENKNKTIVVLVAGSQHIFALTRMGKFYGKKIFNPEKEREFNVHVYVKTKKFSDLLKKIGGIIPSRMIKDMRNWVLAQEYYAEGDAENLKNLILFLLKNYAGIKEIKKVPSPKSRLNYGLYKPKNLYYKNLEEYKKAMSHDDKKPTVGVLLYGGMHFADTKPIADKLFEYLKDDVNFIFTFSNAELNIKAVREYLTNVDLLLNLQYFRIHGGPYGGEPEPTYEFLQNVNAPLLIGLRSYETEIESWRQSKQGINPLEIVLGVTLPELDGAIEPIFVAGLQSFEDKTLGKVKQIEVLEDRIVRLAERIKKWLILRNKPNSEKRIAIITYNYPPGEDNLASAGYLDVFESMKHFLRKLKANGYNVDIPDESLKDLFLSEGVVNSPIYLQKTGIKIPASEYLNWFKTLPSAVQEAVVKHWGEPPGDIMVEKDSILIPGIILGNIFLGVQPSRGVHEDIDKAYHDKDLPPHHQYLAYYLFLQKELKVDAIIHFGMHGTLEFTKGKEVALSSECFPDVLIGNIPHIYYYWIGNTSESTIAKRRSYALCISHASPPMKSSGLYEKYIVLEDLLNQYDDNEDEQTLEMIKELANEIHLPAELEELRKELYKTKRRLIPYGLHIMDRQPSKEETIDYLLGVLRIDREYPSILKLLAKQRGLDWEIIKDTKKGDEIEKIAKDTIEAIVNGISPQGLPNGYVTFIRNIVRNLNETCESYNLLRALEGEYILPARGGDPIRDPEVYPSGRAMYAFDPRLIPTVIAEIRGHKAAELIVKSYLDQHGRYPESVGIVLWGFETMKTGGDTIATILSLLGVRLKHKKSPWFKELEIIPLEELNRPRIDVVITICGIFRDTFGTHIDLLNRAIEMVARLDEPPEKNFIRKHYLQQRDKLKDFALARIFGPSPTEYATSMRTLVESSSWNDEEDLVESYDDSMSYAYLKGGIVRNEQAFSTALEHVDIVTQERDNTEYEVTDLDHYYEFLGGLSRSIESKKGEKAETMVIDTTEEDVAVEDLKIVIERATRTRTLNPKWLEGMLKHDFHGAKKIKDRVEYLLAFAATTKKVENWIFEEVADRLIFDEEMRKKLQANNPYATMKIAELLIESEKRGYWKTEERKLKELRDLILNMESEIE